MTDTIMPCPKCMEGGDQVRADYQHPGETVSNGWRRVCNSCGHEGPLRESGEAATVAWNDQWPSPGPAQVTAPDTLRTAVDKLLADSLPVIVAADAVLQENARLRLRVAELETLVGDAEWRLPSDAPVGTKVDAKTLNGSILRESIRIADDEWTWRGNYFISRNVVGWRPPAGECATGEQR